jgi:hypothetical protein
VHVTGQEQGSVKLKSKSPEIENKLGHLLHWHSMTDETLIKELATFDNLVCGSINKNDDPIDHKVNSSGFRSPEFQKVDLLVAGCSQTFGMGVNYEDTWGYKLALDLNVSYANLGDPGTSNQKIVENIINYVSTYGKPKAICVVFPSLFRFRLAIRTNTLTTSNRKNLGDRILVDNLNMLNQITLGKQPKLSKSPHKVEEILSYESSLYLSIVSINHLIEYCNIGNIDLYISTWDPGTAEFFTLLGKINKRFKYHLIDNLEDFSAGSKIRDCHEMTSLVDYWDIGVDKARHMGAHQHLHYKELFFNLIKGVTK